jgi:hypothetical protein
MESAVRVRSTSINSSLIGYVRQAWKDRLVYLILAECRLILPEAQAPQPHNVHDGAHSGVAAHHRAV